MSEIQHHAEVLKEIKDDTVDIFGDEFVKETEALDFFINFAKDYEAVKGMPEKHLYPESIADTKLGWKKRGRNEAIDECTLAFTKLLDRERLATKIKKTIDEAAMRNHGKDAEAKAHEYKITCSCGRCMLSLEIADAIIKSVGGGDK